ncbi:hypothetical protein CDD80_5269 [Ophiocordyceps camponoti-rufipedis]|uniref:BTB domain-containing protein n=1 Tax=Ophiocordyceps camponoti-rufipedis TaxID=2004952 RepID=A0A2C5ZIM6_9HYPO|nr:hypothetical protein CDD80_5269 [Ophiocordyceps camponoti-rufipedis]
MSLEPFPANDFKRIVVDLLDKIQYNDTNYDTREERGSVLRSVYTEAVKHFAQPHVQKTLNKKVDTIDRVLRSTACVIVCCWTRASSELKAVLTIYYTYILIFDDAQEDLRPSMQGLLEDMVVGRPQGYPWLKLVNDQFLNVMKYYGPFCSLGIYRGTFDFFQGCWIEIQDFTGFRGPGDYPDFLRRLSCFGHPLAASLMPADHFDEREMLVEMTAAICLVEKGMTAINDLLSFYKEYEEGDQKSWVIHYAEVNGVPQTEALTQLARNIVSVSDEVSTVFSEKPFLAETVNRFIQGRQLVALKTAFPANMDQLFYEDIMATPLFRFVVGPDKRNFHIHSTLVARQSPVLDRLINGDSFKESKDQEVIWKDVDEKTFVRFCQFAYTGNYDGPTLRENKATLDKDRENFISQTNQAVKMRPANTPSSGTDRQKATSAPQTNTKQHLDDFKDLFFAHARLYIFADCYQIKKLTDVSFARLRQTLKSYSFVSVDPAVMELYRFSFQEKIPETLRKLMAHYASHHIRQLWEHVEFQGLVKEFQELSASLVGYMVPLLPSHQQLF